MKPVYTWISNQKTHIIYIILIVICLGVGYNLLSRKPKEIIKTLVETKVVIKEVEKEKKIFVDRVTTIKKINGDVITIKDNSRKEERILAKTSEAVTISKTEVIKFLSSYSVDVMFPINPLQITSAPNLLDTQVSVGIRLFDLPLFTVVGVDLHFNKVLIGARLEF